MCPCTSLLLTNTALLFLCSFQEHRPASQATGCRLGTFMYTLTSCCFSFGSKWNATCVTCSSVYKEDSSSLFFQVTLECGCNAALSVFISLPWTEMTQRYPKFRLFPPPSANHMRSSYSHWWAGRRLLRQPWWQLEVWVSCPVQTPVLSVLLRLNLDCVLC